MNSTAPIYKNHRFPIDIVALAVWLYFRFNVSLREVEEMMLERGVAVSYETIRRWCRTHRADYARRLRCKSPSPSDIWHLDELVVRVNGEKCWLWRAVDQDGYLLDEIVQTRRNTKAAKRLLTRLLKKQGMAPKRMVTDKLRSYGAARRQVMPEVERRSHKASTTGPRIRTVCPKSLLKGSLHLQLKQRYSTRAAAAPTAIAPDRFTTIGQGCSIRFSDGFGSGPRGFVRVFVCRKRMHSVFAVYLPRERFRPCPQCVNLDWARFRKRS